MNWNIQKAKIDDAAVITDFQVAMALESEGLVLDKDTVMKGVQTAMSKKISFECYSQLR